MFYRTNDWKRIVKWVKMACLCTSVLIITYFPPLTKYFSLLYAGLTVLLSVCYKAPKKAKKRTAEGANSNVFSMFEQAQIQEFKEVKVAQSIIFLTLIWNGVFFLHVTSSSITMTSSLRWAPRSSSFVHHCVMPTCLFGASLALRQWRLCNAGMTVIAAQTSRLCHQRLGFT